MRRLNPTLLASLPATVSTPRYRREKTRVGSVHLGVGAFHRAHQAWYTEQVLNASGGDWGIIGASLRSSSVRDQLAPQGGLYTVIEKAGDSASYQVIGAIQEVVVGPEDPQALISHLASTAIKVVSLTITEKGYCHDPATGTLQWEHSGIQQDLSGYLIAPVTAIGYLVASLAQRKQHGRTGVTLLSCDNLPHNGRVLQQVVKDFARRVNPPLAEWIAQYVTFPCTMVDRIVPATTAADLHSLQQTLGVVDRGAVVTEPFCQWVMENKFAQAVPDWQRAGALIVDDVAPFEQMKLRLLNGSHSIIAYLGFLAGYDYVHEVMTDAHFSRLVRRYMDEEASPTLNIPEGFKLAAYKQQLLDRFANTALQHKTAQIAQDGSQKIPQRWLNSVQQLEQIGHKTPILALAVAGWLRYLEAVRDNGESFVVDDPMAAQFRSMITETETGEISLVNRVLRIESIFGDLPVRCPRFAADVERLHRQMKANGVKAMIREVASA